MEVLNKLKQRIHEVIIGAVGTAASAFLLFAESWLTPLIASWSPRSVLYTLAGLVFLVAWMLAAVFWLRPWLRFNITTGTYVDRKTGVHYCTSCLSVHKRLTPLTDNSSDEYLRCKAVDCRASYSKQT